MAILNRSDSTFEGKLMKTQNHEQHIALLDPDPAILEYLHCILADRFTNRLFPICF
jgi:hypothetical protein